MSANRYYNLLLDTPENRKIKEHLKALDMMKNVNGEPTYRWKPPQISNSVLKGGSCCTSCQMHGGAMPNSVLVQMDERQPMQRPSGMTSPFIQPPAKYVLAGGVASYPQYNTIEMNLIEKPKFRGGAYSEAEKREITSSRRQNQNKWAYVPMAENDKIKQWMENERNLGKKKPLPIPIPEAEALTGGGALGAMFSSGLKTGAKYGAKYGAQAVKTGIAGAKEGAKIAVMVAKNPAVQAVVTEIAKDPDVQKAVVGQITTLIKGKAAENVVEDVKDEPALEGGRIKKGKAPKGKGQSDGRAKRAEIVKKVMKEQGLKMIEASKYVKANNLY